MPLSRRDLLTRGGAAGLGLALVGSVEGLFAGPAEAAAPVPEQAGLGDAGLEDPALGYGPLVDDPAGRLALPAGFAYTLVSQAGVTRLESGERTPDRPDGTATFPRPAGGTVLVQNHELGTTSYTGYPVPHVSGAPVYDPGAQGGTTNLEVGTKGKRLREYVSLAGTDNNCAGGRTPWDTWLTCEETENRAGSYTVAQPDGSTRTVVLEKDHGYVFEVDPYGATTTGKALKALGRFAHEAAVVDPDVGQVYLTEDSSNPNGLLYRWTPPGNRLPLGKGSLDALGDADGLLEALYAIDVTGALVDDLSRATTVGTRYRTRWVPVPDRDARTVSTRKQFAYPTQAAGEGTAGRITRARKLEGMWWGNGGVHVVSSFARAESPVAHDGQVWFLNPVKQTLTLRTLFAYTPLDQDDDVDGPDNITVSPYGGVILAEDGEGKQHLVGADNAGNSFFFARNMISDEEFTGPTFSRDKKTLFANVQVPGHTFAITGPFADQR